MGRVKAVRIVAGVMGAFFVLLGLWAFFAPALFFERLAAFPPYNQHFIRDIGAFQVGLGSVLLFALVWTDGLLVALAGFSVASILHFFSHLVDRELGGRAADPISFGLIMIVVVLAAVWRARDTRADRPTSKPPPDQES